MPVALSALFALGVLFAPQQPEANQPVGLEAALAAVVDLPDAKARAEGVEGLLKKSDSLDKWLAVCANFGEFEQLEFGPMTETRKLVVLGEHEETDLHLYVPKSYNPTQPAPLLLWGHGAGGSGARQHQLWQDVAEQIGMLILAPTEPIAQGYSKQPRERASTLEALRWARRFANVDENAIFVGGWSRGGHLAWDLALRNPDLFAGMVVCVGGPLMNPPSANNLRYLENVAHLPIRDLQGSGDDPRLLMNLRLAFKNLKKLRAKDVELIEFADRGHDADLSVVDWPTFFAKRRDPWPKKVVRIAADLTETRASWIEITGMRKKVQVEAQPQVAVRRWATMNEEAKRAYIVKALAKNTARVAVQQTGKGRFRAQGFGITKFSLLLAADQLGKGGKVEVRLANKPIRKVAMPSAEVLLLDFVERFDRTRLPVARVDLP
jgi:dipeptidyl aminopeptidase/acylaminoacyl peptidase